MDKTKSILTQHSDQLDWLKKLGFYKDDLAVWQKRLGEIATKNSSHEVMADLEQFQNQWKIQDGQIDLIKHLINMEIRSIEGSISHNPVASDHRKTKANNELEDKMKRFEELFSGFRQNIMIFLAKWM